jgi:VWFA-related protein
MYTCIVTRRQALTVVASGVLHRAYVRAQESVLPAREPLVNVHVGVRTRSGEIVRDLGIQDFEIEESERVQQIRSFTRDADTPVTLGVLMDTGASERGVFDQVHDASYRFLGRVLRTQGPLEKQDRTFVMLFDSSQRESRRPLDRDLRELEAALRIAPVVERRNIIARPPGGLLIRGDGSLYDALVQACEQFLKGERGRKACIAVSDGIDYGSESTLEAAIESAQRADTSIYTIQYFDSRSFSPRRVSLEYWRRTGALALSRMSRETGGAYFQVSDTQTLETIYALLEEDLRSGYGLAYTPDPFVSGYRRIRVIVKRPGLMARYREGYYVEPGAPPALPPRITAVDPVKANAGDLVTAQGAGLDRSNIHAVYLTDGVRTLPALLVAQTTAALQFKVPEEAAAGPWTVGQRRPFEWTLVLELVDGTLLSYTAFRIATD